jgi:hypothetical protein
MKQSKGYGGLPQSSGRYPLLLRAIRPDFMINIILVLAINRTTVLVSEGVADTEGLERACLL